MAEKSGQKTETAAVEFVFSRVFNAPRRQVFNAWTNCEHLMKWWGPKGCTMEFCRIDLRPGGIYHYGMRTPDGGMMWGKFVFREVSAPGRLVYVSSFSDEHGGITRHPLAAGWPLEMLSTMTLEEHEGKTTVTMNVVPINESEAERRTFVDGHRSMQGGWSGTLDRLDAHLNAEDAVPDCLSGFKPVEHELTLTRLIDAPRELVFQAWTDEKHMAKWWGPNGFTNPVCELDPRPGGRIHIDMRGPNGVVYPMGGTFHQVTPPERLVFTSTAMEDEDGQPQLEVHNTITFENQSGKTMLKLHAVVVKSSAAVAKALAGMEQGWTESLLRLGALVAAS